jgi:hypothetical protein
MLTASPPTAAGDPRRDPTRWITRGLLLVAAGATAFVAWAPGVAEALFERGSTCAFRAATGLLCPFCGLTHATVALLRGNLAEAAREHPFAVAYVLGVLALTRRSFTAAPRPMSGRARLTVAVVAAAFLAYAVARNL